MKNTIDRKGGHLLVVERLGGAEKKVVVSKNVRDMTIYILIFCSC